MADAISVSGPDQCGTDKTLTFETGKLAPASPTARSSPRSATPSSSSPSPRRQAPRGHRLLPPDGRRRGADVRRRARSPARSSVVRAGPSEPAILTCRLTDRPLRPSFPDGFRNEVQVIATILGADQENPHDVLAINGASAALMISGIPFDGPIGAVRIACTTRASGSPHPTYEEGDESHLRARRRRPPASTTATSPS